MSVQRYTKALFKESLLAQYTLSGGSIVAQGLGFTDIALVNDADKPDLDVFMASLGASFIATAPVGSTYVSFENGVTTLDATPTVALSIPTQDVTSYCVRANIAARNGASGVSGVFELLGGFRRDAGVATIVQLGTTGVVFQALQNLLWGATFAVNATTGEIEVVVTGVAATTIKWYVGSLVTQVT